MKMILAEIGLLETRVAKAAQLNRLQSDWSKIAKEELKIEKIKGALYGYSSELAFLSLFHKYNEQSLNKKSRVSFSSNQNSSFF